MVDDFSARTSTKWNFDEERMKALSTYITIAEQSFNNFTSYDGMNPIENLYGTLSTVKRAMIGTGTKDDDEKIKEKYKELEKIKRDCNIIFIKGMNTPKEQLEFVQKSIKFLNEAEQIQELIHKLNTKNGLYFRRTEDPGRAIEM